MPVSSRFPLLALLICFCLAAVAPRCVSAQLTNVFDYSSGFPSAAGLTLNGDASLQGSALQLTSSQPFQTSSVFTSSRYSIKEFSTSFTFQITDPTADGFAFVLQDAGADALGSSGAGVGYGMTPGAATGQSIPNSLAFIFDLYNNPGQVSNTLRIVSGGSLTAIASVPSTTIDLSPLNLHSGHRFKMSIANVLNRDSVPDGIYLELLDLDDTTLQLGQILPILPPTYTSSARAYAGFTAATGAKTSAIRILGWQLAAETNDCSVMTSACYCPVDNCGSTPAYDNGFAGATGLQLNNEARIDGSLLDLTNDSTFEANSAFYTGLIVLNDFTTDFDFRLGPASPPNQGGDGFALVLQTNSPEAVGTAGDSLGYQYIQNSVAIKFDMHNNAGETDNSTGVYENGAPPTVPAIVIPPGTVNFHSGHTFHAHVSYSYNLATPSDDTLSINLTDLTDFSTFQTTVPIDLAAVLGTYYAYPGFTAGTGAEANTVQILNWTWGTTTY